MVPASSEGRGSSPMGPGWSDPVTISAGKHPGQDGRSSSIRIDQMLTRRICSLRIEGVQDKVHDVRRLRDIGHKVKHMIEWHDHDSDTTVCAPSESFRLKVFLTPKSFF